MKRAKKAILSLVILLISAILLAMGLDAYIQKDTAALIYKEIDKIPSVKTAIVLGASVHADGKLSPILKDRVDTALELYQQQKIKQILVSGDHKTDDYDEVNAMSNYLVNRGVKKQDIILDHSGFDTYDSMYRAGKVFGIEDAIVVTQGFHLPRALFIAKGLQLNYMGLAAGSKAYRADNKIRRREKFANFKALWEIIVNQNPRTMEKDES